MSVFPMGLGLIGQPSVIFKRKYRWIFTIQSAGSIQFSVPPWWCKVAARPQLEIDELEIPFLNQTTWFPGRAKWQPLTVSFLDTVTTGINGLQGLYNWIASVYDFQGGGSDGSSTYSQTEKAGWNANGILVMLDGCGAELETWVLGSIWPQSINFGELDMGTNEVATIDITFRYSDVSLTSSCGPSPNGQCTGC